MRTKFLYKLTSKQLTFIVVNEQKVIGSVFAFGDNEFGQLAVITKLKM